MKKILIAATIGAAAFAAQAKDIVDTAVAAGNFGTLATALQAAGLVDTLKGVRQDPQGRPRCTAEGQGQADRRADLPRRAGQGDGQGREGRHGEDRARQ